jgi:Na+/proline symporter
MQLSPGQQMPSALFMVIIFAPILYLVLLGLYRRRQGIRHKLRGLVVALAGYIGTVILLVNNGVQSPLVVVVIAVLVGLAVERIMIRPRSRHIPAAERRKAIAVYERKTGRKFNPRNDELDHEIAFARLGNSTADNLKVIPRRANRSKGKKAVWWDLLGR